MFTKATEYALRATIFIAQNSSEENKLTLTEISKGIKSPRSFTAKFLQLLTSGNKIVSSMRGPTGGFYMSEKAKRLPARSILEVMKEGGTLDKCVLGLRKCSEASPCPMHAEYKFIKQQLIQLFETKTILILAEELKNGRSLY